MDNKVTRERIERHLEYDWVKYIIIILAAILIWVFIYQVTNTVPDFKKIDILAVTPTPADKVKQDMSADIQKMFGEGTEIEQLNWDVIAADEQTLGTIMMTRAKTSDIFIAPADIFRRYVAAGFFLDLDKPVEYFLPGDLGAVEEKDAFYVHKVTDEDLKDIDKEDHDRYRELYDNKKFGITLNKVDGNMFFRYGKVIEKDEEGKDVETDKDIEYIMGIVGVDLTASNGGGNRGSFNGSKIDKSHAEVFDFFRYLFRKNTDGIYPYTKYLASV